MLWRMDEQANRDVLLDEAAAVGRLRQLADRDDLAARGERVSLLRTLGRLDEAATEAEMAARLAERTGTPVQRVKALLRLAHVRQWRREWTVADALFADALTLAQQLDDPLLLAFVHQHAGRNHVDQGRYAAAIDSFQAAPSSPIMEKSRFTGIN